jgi:hypothetical protein
VSNWLEAEQARRRLHIGIFVAVEGRLDLSVEWLRKFFRFRTFARVACCARSVSSVRLLQLMRACAPQLAAQAACPRCGQRARVLWALRRLCAGSPKSLGVAVSLLALTMWWVRERMA